jgi:pilus assembly protein CpaF
VFGKRSGTATDSRGAPVLTVPVAPPSSAPVAAPAAAVPAATVRNGGGTTTPQASEPSLDTRHSEAFYEVKSSIFTALIEAIDLSQLGKLDADSAREEIRDIVNEIIGIKNIVMSISEQEELLDDRARGEVP